MIRASKKNDMGCKLSLVPWKLKKNDQLKGTTNSFNKITAHSHAIIKILKADCNRIYSE
jgi:hypothetical protein